MDHRTIRVTSIGCILAFFALAAMAIAAGTPVWWDNPKDLPNWTKTTGTGTASNTGPQAQYIIAKIDVPNQYRENYSKYVWVQVEWSLVAGTGAFMTGSTDHLIKWLNSAEQCPANPELPFPEPDGAGFMKSEGAFAPEFGFQNAFELSYSKITPQPACERVEVRFEVGPNSRIDYRVEIQTACINWDFGDAPDPAFPTLLAHNGARHIITDCYLGSQIDAENNGQQDAHATGDDLNGDDEDGVFIADAGHLTQGGEVALTVTASRTGFLNAWADFNRNGSWADPAEQIFADRPLLAGANALSFAIPAGADTGLTFIRFRFGTDQKLSFNGVAGDGEVEDYEIDILPAEYDFGDAPDPSFPTLLKNDGARHRIGKMKLGSLVDADKDGQPSTDATGDDSDGSDDDDGVVFNATTLVKGGVGAVAIAASGPGLLSAWIDFNNNGSWGDSGEQIFADKALIAGANELSFDIPRFAKVANVCARFRFSSSAQLTPSGPADDGEVEDYLISVLLPVELSSFSARQFMGTVTLEWTTQSETENLGFYIYRAEGAGEFERISERLIDGAGTSTTLHTYDFRDASVLAGKTYRYKLADLDRSGQLRFGSAVEITVAAPEEYALEQNYPNPFNPMTVIAFKLKQSGFVSLEIYNLKGQLVKSLISRSLEAGSHAMVWDARDAKGNAVPTGSYLYKLKTEQFEQVKMMEYIK